eukprot:44438_1
MQERPFVIALYSTLYSFYLDTLYYHSFIFHLCTLIKGFRLFYEQCQLYKNIHIMDSKIFNKHIKSSHSYLSIPTLMLIGPAKTGTTFLYRYLLPHTFDNVITFRDGNERQILNLYSCYPNQNELETMQFYPLNISKIIDLFIQKSLWIKQESMKFPNYTQLTECEIFYYDHQWSEMNHGKYIKKWKTSTDKTCIPPQYYYRLTLQNERKYCVTVEKNPHYASSPMRAILLTHYKPMLKILMTVRNPIHQIWSFYFQELVNYGKLNKIIVETGNNESLIIQSSESEIHSWFTYNIAFNVSDDLCEKFITSDESELIDENNKVLNGIIAKYFEIYFNKKKYGGMKMNRRWNMNIFSSLYFFHILAWMKSYENIGVKTSLEMSKYFRITQQEWFYKNTEKGMILLNDWAINPYNGHMQSEREIIYNRIRVRVKKLTDEYRNNKDKYSDQYSGHKSIGEKTVGFETFLNEKYEKCNKALLRLINSENELLMGDWIDW